jgi:ABC-type sugar transport system substrate-binding protein
MGSLRRGPLSWEKSFRWLLLHDEFPGSITSELTTSRVLYSQSNTFIESGIVGLRFWAVTRIPSAATIVLRDQQALSQLKVKFDPLLVVPSDLNRRGGFDGVQKLIKAKNPPTAVLCFNDVVALGAMEGIQRLGRKPGVDFGIVGFNNIPDAAQCVPGLTTIENSPSQLGESAAELLLKRIEQRDAPIRTLILQPQLIVRESCGAPLFEIKTVN